MASATSLSSKGIAYGLLALVGAVVVYLFGFSRGLESMATASQERANNQAKIDALKQKLTDLKTLQEEFAQAQPLVDSLTVAMPADEQFAEVVAMVETMAARAGLLLETIQPASPTVDGLPLSITVRGSYGGILTFIEILEKNVRPFKIGPINIAGGEAGLSATINVTALFQVPPEDLPQTTPEGAE